MKSKKGITLISLVITIIVLMILVGVSLSATFGDSGVITKAQSASSATKETNAKERIILAWNDCNMDYAEAKLENENVERANYFTEEKMLEALGSTDEMTNYEYDNDTGAITLTYEEQSTVYNFNIDSNGNITLVEDED
jgi:type II secretory pathway pseudopilin PulG